MALEKVITPASYFLRWDEEGNAQGASATQYISIFEDGELISRTETQLQDALSVDFPLTDFLSEAQANLVIQAQELAAERDTALAQVVTLTKELGALQSQVAAFQAQIAELEAAAAAPESDDVAV